MANKHKITVLGDGGWGTTLSILLSRKGFDVCLWGAFKDYIDYIDKKRINVKFLPGIKIPSSIYITYDLNEATNFSNDIVLAVPSQYLRSILKKIKSRNLSDKLFLSVVKGIEEESLLRMSDVVLGELGKVKLAVLSGPNISHEIARGMPAVSVVASKDHDVAKHFQDILMCDSFRIYTNRDVTGVELGGSLKNVIALACGISDGLKFGTNAKAALLTRGIVEMARLGVAMGAKRDTFFGISGLGDLVTTCCSSSSRNRSVGEKIGRGEKLTHVMKHMQMVVEGVTTAKAAYELSKRYKVDMPITREIYLVLYKNKSPNKAVRDLMSRDKKAE